MKHETTFQQTLRHGVSPDTRRHWVTAGYLLLSVFLTALSFSLPPLAEWMTPRTARTIEFRAISMATLPPSVPPRPAPPHPAPTVSRPRAPAPPLRPGALLAQAPPRLAVPPVPAHLPPLELPAFGDVPVAAPTAAATTTDASGGTVGAPSAPMPPAEGAALPLAETLDTPPRPQLQPSPAYPPAARARGITGYVDLRFTVTAEGRVADAAVVAGQPEGIFDLAAVESVSRWRFTPGLQAGRAVPCRLQLRIRFTLKDD